MKNYIKHITAILVTFGTINGFGQTWDEIIKITASDAASGDKFGERVAIDGNYAIVASGSDDVSGSNSGSAYVFELVGGVWEEVQKLNASDVSAGDWFGSDVSVSGNFALISAMQNDDAGSNSGAAYIFERNDVGVWVEIQKLTASDAASGDLFGGTVSIDGQYAVVAAENENGNTGAAYIFEQDDSDTWVEVQKLTASDATSSDGFGNAVELLGDRVVIGARLQDFDISHPNSGTAYLFERNEDGLWIETHQFFASDYASNDRFGRDVALNENSVIIGAFYDDDSGSNSGSAYVFEQNEFDVWVETQKLTASDGAASDWFGREVAINNNYAVVTAPVDDDAGSSSGSAYIFEKDIDGIWVEIQKVTASDAAANDWFGFSADITEGHLIIGALNNDDAGSSSGSAYIFGDCDAMTVTVSSSEVCFGDEVTLDATSLSDADITWTEGVVDGEPFVPEVGVTTFIATGGDVDCELQVDITVYESPDVTISATDSIICEGDEITLTGEGAISYVWEDGVVDGETFTPPLGETTYTVTGTNDDGCENEESINIMVNVLPEVIATADDSVVCAGEMVTLVGEGAITYEWDGGVTDGVAFEPPVGETTYTVTGTDDNDCENSATISITVNALPEVEATADDTEVCDGEEITLVGEGAITYAWDGGVTDGVAFTSPVGETTYTVTGTDDNDCSATDSIIITVFENPEVEIEALEDDVLCITAAPVELVASPASGTFSGTGVSGTTFEPNTAGEGTHTIYYYYENDEGCSATDSVEVSVVDCLSIPEYDNLSMKVYPNPFTDFATIAFDRELKGDHTIVIYDILGKKVSSYHNLSGNQLIISREELPSGVYFLSVLSQSETVGTVRLVVQ